MIHKTIISSLMLVVSLSFAYAETYQNYTAYVIANSLRLRAAPGQSSKTIKLLPYLDKLSIIPATDPKKVDTIDNIAGHWVHVLAGQDSGYVFSGYIFGYPPAKPRTDIVMLDPEALSYSTWSYSPHYHWYRLGRLNKTSLLQGLTSVDIEFFVGGNAELDVRVSDSLPGYIIGFREKQEEGAVKTNSELDDLIARMAYYPGLKLLPGQHFFLWSTMQYPGQEQPAQRNSFHLLVTGTVKNEPYLFAKDYQILLTHSTEFPNDATHSSYAITPNLFGENERNSLVSSVDQYLEFSTPYLRFAGDINGDGMPDVIIYTTDDKTSYRILITSEVTTKGVQYKIATMIEYGPGC